MKNQLPLERIINILPDEQQDLIATAAAEEGLSTKELSVKRAQTSGTVKALAEGERAAIRYISTRTVDRDLEALDPAGVVTSQYEANPIVLWAHDYSQPPIGKSVWLAQDPYGIQSKTVYAETERAEEVWQLVKGGFLRTSSVGFIALQRVYKGSAAWRDTVAYYNEKWKTDLEASGCQTITSKWILLEYSDVPIPSNPAALVTEVAKGHLHLSTKTFDQLGLGKQAKPTSPTGVIEIISLPNTASAVTPRSTGIIEVNAEPGKYRATPYKYRS